MAVPCSDKKAQVGKALNSLQKQVLLRSLCIYLRRGATKAGVAAQDTWSAACESAALQMRGAYVMVTEGAEKQAGRLWDEFGMKEVVKEKRDTLYIGVGHHHKAVACVCHAQEGMRLIEVGRRHQRQRRQIPSKFEWWDTTCARAPRPRRKTFSIVSVAARTRQYGVGLKRSKCVCYIWSV